MQLKIFFSSKKEQKKHTKIKFIQGLPGSIYTVLFYVEFVGNKKKQKKRNNKKINKFDSDGRNLKRLKISRIYVHIMENVIKKSIECLLLNFMVKYFL